VLDLARRTGLTACRSLKFEVTDHFDFGSVEYHRLFSQARMSAFQHPDWLAAFYRHLAPAHGAKPLVVTGRNAQGDLRLVVPLVRLADLDGLNRIEYAFLGVTDYACPVMADGTLPGPETAQCFRDVLGPHHGLTIGPVHRDHVHQWRLLLGTEPLTLAFGAHAVDYSFPYAEWRRSNLGTLYAATLDRKARRLADRGGLRLELVQAQDVRSAMVAARDFRAGRFRGDPLQTTHGLEFYTDVATTGARSGLARTYRLATEDGCIALVFGLVDGGCFRYILLACNYPLYSRRSPGRVALDRVMAAWAVDGGTSFDFTIGDEPFKAGFGCSRSPMYEFRL